eukprot:scaffold76107_cov45-Phaeocystis_antarctica.AAC.1
MRASSVCDASGKYSPPDTAVRASLGTALHHALPVRAGGSLTNARAVEGSAHPRNHARLPSRCGRQPPERRAR